VGRPGIPTLVARDLTPTPVKIIGVVVGVFERAVEGGAGLRRGGATWAGHFVGAGWGNDGGGAKGPVAVCAGTAPPGAGGIVSTAQTSAPRNARVVLRMRMTHTPSHSILAQQSLSCQISGPYGSAMLGSRLKRCLIAAIVWATS
jgi:hypothetical protein